MKRAIGPTLAAAALAGLLFGCAPTAALKGAGDAYASAKSAGAKDKAPYEFYAAKIYLDLAREVNKEKAYGPARSFAEKSLEFSRQAFEKSGGGVK